MKTSPFLRNTKDTPIILIGHSMGGLVIKKVYILAQQDPRDHLLASRIQCMFFLATPHRGSESARLLNNILRASTVLSPRQYIVDIFKGSPSLQVINDDFRGFADRLQLWSFYETLKTRTTPTSSVLIVERDSAVLGYKGEIAQPLNADHRSICKFDSLKDPNCISIRNSLSTAIENMLGKVFLNRTEETKLSIRRIETFLMISHNAEDDLITAEASKTEGTCEWVIDLESFQHWKIASSGKSLYFWVTGAPGSGKTVLATHIIRHLQGLGAEVCYHFFHHGTQQFIGGLLRQLAYQIALCHPDLLQRLYTMQNEGVTFDKDDERVIWRKFFLNEILNLHLERPQYWVIDGLDECADASKLFGLIVKLDASFPIRFCFTTRKRPDFDKHFSRLEPRPDTYHIEASRTMRDIETYIRDNATLLPVDGDESESLIQRIVTKSNGIFLWAKLALEELERVYSDESVDKVLEELPGEMASIYGKILHTMAVNTRELKLTKAILTWVICASRTLSIQELQVSLNLDLATNLKSVERSVEGLCGQLLRIDESGTVRVIHSTVRDFLLDQDLEIPLAIQEDIGHERLAIVCLRYLASDEMRPPKNRLLVQIPSTTTSAFADYACTLFSEHIIKASAQSDEVLGLLYKFFQTNVLRWIEYIARHKGDLFFVIQAARNLRHYLGRRVKYTSSLKDQCSFIEKWISDLIRVVAKFRENLIQFPSSIFYLVAPLCPTGSAISGQFNTTQNGFKLLGSGNANWDDCVSYIDYRGTRALSLTSGENVFAIGQKTGHVRIYHAATCQEKTVLNHGEPVKFLKFDNSTQRLFASGGRRLSMFSVSGTLLWTMDHRDAIAAASFSVSDNTVTVATRTSSIIHFSALDGQILPGESLGKRDIKQLKATTPQAIRSADVSPDQKIIAIAYQYLPVKVWSLEKDELLGTCWFKRDTPGKVCPPVSGVLFNPNPAVEVLAVASQDGELALFDSWTQQEIISVSGEAYILACTPDGRTLATGDMRGTIKLWDFDTLTLLYRIKSDGYEVRFLSFSSDGLRLYDIREAKTNVWEPSALVRKGLPDKSSISESVAQPATVVDRSHETVDITSIAAMGASQLVLVGRTDGLVALFDVSTASIRTRVYSHHHHLMVRQVSWSAEGYVAMTDVSSVLRIWAIPEIANSSVEAQQEVMEVEIPSLVQNIALSPRGCKILVCEALHDSIYWIPITAIPSTPRISTIKEDWHAIRTWTWLLQPLAGSDIVMVSESILHLYQTNDTTNEITLKSKITLMLDGSRLPSQVEKLNPTKTSIFLAVILPSTRDLNSPKVLIFSLDQSQDRTERSDDSELRNIEPVLCLRKKTVRMFIGWNQHSIVFLDTDLWICSIDMASVQSGSKRSYTVRRHFFILCELIGSDNGYNLAPVLAGETSIVFPREKSLSLIEGALSSVFMSEEVVQ
ncbi:hypothetical protein F4808DRAFT_432983 [Astrocystis sublimbata]|nr:hypothetical protein F4808DRAFT_432983 [Astrocystis sublimbata]